MREFSIPPRHRIPLFLLLCLAVLANAIALSGFFNTDPAFACIGLVENVSPGWAPGPMGWFDPTVAYIVQPIGYLAASDWLHGMVPWWNPYSGVGMPLAAEMQAMAFFLPFVFLLHWHIGWLLLRVVLQAMSGMAFYALLIELKLARLAAFLGGALYALSPIFFLDPHASMAPLPFLPLLLWGIEQAASGARGGDRLGCPLIAVALAYSIYAGFPEVTFFDGLLAGVWTLWRGLSLPAGAWLRFTGRIALGVGAGLCLAAPLLIPFLEYMQRAWVGLHTGARFAGVVLAPIYLPLQLLPNLYGVFGVYDNGPYGITPPPGAEMLFNQSGSIGRVPGWVGLPVLALALAAVLRRGPWRTLRLLLFFWVALWEARYVGVGPVVRALNLIPGIAACDSSRFSGPVVNFAIYALAAFGFDDYLRRPAMRIRQVALLVGVTAVLLATAILPARQLLALLWASAPGQMLVALAAAGGAFFVLAWLAVALCRPGRHGWLVCLLIAGPLAGFMFPQLAGLRGGAMDKAPIAWLRAHIGMDRMMSLGSLDANFPARYAIASINYASMPAPLLFANYITSHLNTGTDLSIYRGLSPGQLDLLRADPAGFEALGVRYVVASPWDDFGSTQRFQPVDAGARDVAHALLPGGPPLTGLLTARLPFRRVTGITVRIGTYFGTARGTLSVTLCAAGTCAHGAADVSKAPDDAPLGVTFATPLDVPPQAPITYRFSHAAGAPVAIWLAPAGHGGEQPVISFYSAPPGALTPEFRDANVVIYALPDPAPYAQAQNCQLVIVSRQAMETRCAAPSTLLRREMFYPGWRAVVNGKTEAVTQAGLFQRIEVPQGDATERFTYAPPHIRLACGLAVLAGLSLAGMGTRGRFFAKKLRKKLL